MENVEKQLLDQLKRFQSGQEQLLGQLNQISRRLTLLEAVQARSNIDANFPTLGPVNLSGGWPQMEVATAAAASAAESASDAATTTTDSEAEVVSLNTLTDPAPVLAILPVLEEVQMETAEVLPEIDQSLEQIDQTMAGIDLASASLAPTPEKIPLIQKGMTDASAAIDKTLGEI
jgi:hypothetical protein